MDDIRNHDPAPTEQEREWMAPDAFAVLFRAAALAGFALTVGFGASFVIEQANAMPVVTQVSR